MSRPRHGHASMAAINRRDRKAKAYADKLFRERHGLPALVTPTAAAKARKQPLLKTILHSGRNLKK